MSASSEDRSAPHGGNRLALLVAGTFFMEIFDGTVIAPAAPRIAADFSVAATQISVAITAYLLTLAVLIPGSGWAADRWSPRRVFQIAIVVFAVASGLCALAPNLAVLTVFRVLQGVGGALMVPVGRLVVLRATAKADLVRAIAYLTWPALTAPLIAPAVGGLVAEHASWRWIFVVNVPLGAIAFVAARLLVPSGGGEKTTPLDKVGFALIAAGMALLVLGLDGVRGQAWPLVTAEIVAGLAVLTLAVRHLRRTDAPLLDLKVLRIHTFRVAAAGGSVYRMVITAIPFLLPLYFQLGLGWNSAQAGLAVIPLFAGNLGIKPATTALMRLFGIRTVLIGAIIGGAACLASFGWVAGTLTVLLPVLVLSGMFRSIGFTAYNSAAFADVPAPELSRSNALFAALNEIGSGLGVAVGALLTEWGPAVARAFRLATTADTPYQFAFLALALLMVVPFVDACLLPKSAARAVTGGR